MTSVRGRLRRAFSSVDTSRPFTGATIEYETAAGLQQDRSDTLLVRADAVTWVAHAQDERIVLPDVRPSSDTLSLAKDVTTEISDR